MRPPAWLPAWSRAASCVSRTTPTIPPQSSVDQRTGKLVGFDVDVAKRVAAILGLGIRFKNPAWETIPANLQAHRYYDVSIGSMEITPPRQRIVDFADPYYYMPAQVFVKRGGKQIHGVTDLFGKRVGVGAGTPYRDFLRRYPAIRLKTYVTDADAFPDLRSGKIRFLLTARATGQQAIQYGQPFQFSGRALFHVRIAFAVGKGQADWLALLDHAARRMHHDGSLSAMSKKWYQGRDWTVWRWRR